jgi:hypothetical protein
MMLFVAWIVFPVVLCLLALGCGLLVELAAGAKLPGTLLIPCGLALMTVTGVLCAASDATAELALPVTIALTIIGLGLGVPRRSLKPDPWALATALGVFAVFAAPVVLSGEATFAGYIKLDDTATWFAITDQIPDHGRDLSALAPSSYEATLHSTVGAGYPIGSFTPLAAARQLVGVDVAWVFQPYLTLLAAMLALSLYELVRGLVKSPPLRAAAAFISAQPALLFGYALWGGVKELGVAMLVATLAALVPVVVASDRIARGTIAPAIVAGALIAVLSFGGLAWVGPILVGGGALLLWRRGFAISARRAVGFGALALLLAAPALLSSRTFFNNASKSALTGGELGNLLHPLSGLQAFGIWPVGDFRLRPEEMTATRLLIAVALASGVWGLICAWRRRSWGLLLYVCSAAITCVVLLAIGSPWIDGKTLTVASPAFLLAGMVGAALLVQGGRGVEGAVLIAAIAGGVLWSNVLAYHEVSLAPRDQLAELEQVAVKYGGQGPALMTEYQPYGVRHFLRSSDAEGASELRRHVVPLIGGASLEKGAYSDIDRFDQGGLRDFRTLVLRRSPAASRPPIGFELVWQGRFYEVWQRSESAPQPIEHLPLGDVVHPVGRAPCKRVLRLAAQAAPAGRLAYVVRPQALVIGLPDARHPSSWSGDPVSPNVLFPHGSGSLYTSIELRRGGRQGFWLGGSVRGEVELLVGGRKIGSARQLLNNDGQYMDLGTAQLSPGRHELELRYRAGGLRPGSGGAAFGLGPLLVAPDSIRNPVRYLDAGEARLLCGRELDWIEALPGK